MRSAPRKLRRITAGSRRRAGQSVINALPISAVFCVSDEPLRCLQAICLTDSFQTIHPLVLLTEASRVD